MKLEHHIAVSTVISGILFLLFKSWSLSAASFVSGIFIDIDHLIDYLIDHKSCFDRKEFFSYFHSEKHQKIRLIFHGWEWLIFLIVTTIATNWNPWVTGVLIGYGHHIVLDLFHSKASLYSYSLMWKWKNGFDSMVISPRDRGYNPIISKKE